MGSSREVTVYAKESTYRARVEPSTKGRFRRRTGYRFVIERIWSKLGNMADPEDWKVSYASDLFGSRAAAKQAAEQWLDEAESMNPPDDDYV